MAVTLRELARLVNAEVQGNPETEIAGAASLRNAGPQEITLLEKATHLKYLKQRSPAAVVAPPGVAPTELNALICSDCHAAFAKIVHELQPLPQSAQCGVCPGAHVHPTARLAEDVTIMPGAVVGEHVEIGRGSIIHSGCCIMTGSVIGADCVLFPNVVLYEATKLGDRVLIHANATLGAYGFGYRTQAGRHQLTPQLGHVEVGNDAEIGAGTTIDRGTYDRTTIGEGTKIDNQVMIGHNCRIGRHNILCAQVGIAGSVHTGDYVVLAGQVGVRDHLDLGDGARVGAQSGVADDVPAGADFLGTPACPHRDQRHIYIAISKLPAMRRQLRSLEHELEALKGQQRGPDADREAA